MLFASKKVIGLDIGSSSIKMAELEVSGQGAKLVGFGALPTPQNAFNNGDILDPAALGSTVRQLMNEFKLKRKSVCMGLAGTAVIVKKIETPRMDRKLMDDHIYLEAEQYIPFDVNSISLSYQILRGNESGEMMEVLLIAAPNQVVGNYIQISQGAGLKLDILDVSGFALSNIFEFNYGTLGGQTVGLLNIGATTSNFVVVNSGQVTFSRDMNIGGQNYTYEIHKELGISLLEAEGLKLSAIRGEGVPDEVHSVMASVNDLVTEEIRNSIEFYAGSSVDRNLSQIFYTGGAAGTTGLVETISQATSLRAEPLNPFLRIAPGSKSLTPSYLQQMAPYSSVALGLALRKVGDT